jgi:integrase
MARPKKQVKLKEPVRLRTADLKNGNKSLYLDIYRDGRRTKQYLKLYLVPEVDYSAKMQNQNTLMQANAIKSEMILKVTNKVAGITDQSHRATMLYVEWLQIYRDKVMAKKSESARRFIVRLIAEIKEYNGEVTLGDIDRDYIMGFLDYLQGRKSYTREHNALSKDSVFNYLAYIRASLNRAVKENIIRKNPFTGIKRNMLFGSETKREYLTVDEIKRLIDTPCRREDMKAAFLFSCFCGLRIMDIKLLKWKHITKTQAYWQVEITQYKTGKQIYLPLNHNARKWMPEQGELGPEDLVFPKLSIWYDKTLSDWALAADVHKQFSFHVARHTFATLALTAGVDIYTTSQLLGHTTIRHTQRYAKIINSKRIDAVSLLDDAFVHSNQ